MSTFLYSKTPSVTIFDNRGLTVREMAYHRHPDTPDVTDERITRHQFDARGLPSQSADPRLYAAGLANFVFISDLGGTPLRTQSADAGTTVVLNDAAGRTVLQVSNIGAGNDRSAAVTRTFQYEDAGLPGRPLSVTEQGKISERFVWAGNSADEQSHNLAGQLVSHYDPAGLLSTSSISLSGVPLSVTRQLLPDGAEADWQGADASAWNDLLAGETYTTTSTVDSAGNVLTTTDAKGNVQRVAYDVAGLLKGSWLTVNGGSEQVIVKSLSYSAAGQKLREEHGNGVVTTYSYEAETQRLVGIKTERTTAAKVLQDLRYEYDPVGNVLVITNDAEETRFWRNQEVVPENRYTYDSLYQLISATGREMANAVQQGSSFPPYSSFDDATYTNYSRTYTYDNAGNLTQIRHSAPASGNSYTTSITVSDRSNRAVLSTFTENPADVEALFTAGGQQKQLLPGQTLQWTARQELQQVTPVTRDGAADDKESYRYDAASQRIVKVTSQLTGNTTQTKQVIYLPGLELRSSATEELQVITVGEAGRAQVRVLHWESGQPDGISNDPIRYSYDNLTGSSSLEVDSNGELISQEEYYPFGGTALFAARSQLEADYKTIRYSGKEQDATGLYYYGYRYYQPWAGRWLSADPAGGIDGLNLFRMVRNNPVRYRDNNGLQPNENPASIIGNVLSERFNEEMTKPGQQSWSISTEEPFETLQKVVTDLVARKQTPVFMMIDMQRLQTASTGIKALFNKGKVRTNPETERRHIEIINFAKEKKLPMIDVNYLFSAMKGIPKGESMESLTNKVKTYSKLRTPMESVPDSWRMLKKSESLFTPGMDISTQEVAGVNNADRIMTTSQFLAKFADNPIVLMGQLEDVCVRMTAMDLLRMGKNVLVSQDLIVDDKNQNNISGITTTKAGYWDYPAKRTAPNSEYKGNLVFFTKKVAAKSRASQMQN
ncbi:RHS repeat protein [Kosakonia pseudosacchari]|uniref:Insecticidal toxin SepC/TccC n=1 Tax=Kosakonia pseudosacchari TaxID=1646340 RepID=A0ABX4IRL2_9ENTR|nr:RHS repeat domain-containing protein [Kosakonia pseudosacchari]PDO87654.1 insecticidal toxin SepC/TccC [Kosakonia pseudosacchari]